VILENPQDDAIAHLFGGFFYALNDIYTQGGIYNYNFINSDFLLDNPIIQEEKND